LLDIIMLNKKGTAGFNTRLCLFCWLPSYLNNP